MRNCYTICFLLILLACCRASEERRYYSLNMEGWCDAFSYPDSFTAKDSLFLAFPLKRMAIREDSFDYALFSTDFLMDYEEPNLSLGYCGEDTYRLIIWGDSNYSPVSIRFNPNEMIVKKCVRGKFHAGIDRYSLNMEEMRQFKFMYRYLLRNETPDDSWTKNYYDSLTRDEPRVQSMDYLIELYKKQLKKQLYAIEVKSIPMTKAKFCELVSALEKTNFRKYSWEQPDLTYLNNGRSFILEAHTPSRYKFLNYGLARGKPQPITIFCRELAKIAGFDTTQIRL